MALILFHIIIIAVLMGGSLSVALVYRLKYRRATRQFLDLNVRHCDAMLIINGLMDIYHVRPAAKDEAIDPDKLARGFVEGFMEDPNEFPGIGKTPFTVVFDQGYHQDDIFSAMGIPADRQGWKTVSSNELKN